LKAYSSNPAYDCVFNPLIENVYDKQPNTIQPFELRVKSQFENSVKTLDDIAPIIIPENRPWLNPKPTFNFELIQYKKSETNPLLIQQQFAEIRSVTSEYSAIYTILKNKAYNILVYKTNRLYIQIKEILKDKTIYLKHIVYMAEYSDVTDLISANCC
jgi:hypothetical protein